MGFSHFGSRAFAQERLCSLRSHICALSRLCVCLLRLFFTMPSKALLALQKQVEDIAKMLTAAQAAVDKQVAEEAKAQKITFEKASGAAEKAANPVLHKQAAGKTAAKPQQKAWGLVKNPKPKQDVKSVGITDTLDADGWSVPVAADWKGVKASSSPAVVLATRVEAAQFVTDMSHAMVPIAVVTSKAVNESSSQLDVRVRDKAGEMRIRQRFLTKVGSSAEVVTYTPPATKVAPKAATRVGVVAVWKRWASKEEWQDVCQNPVRVFKSRLQKAEIETVDVFRPTRVVASDGSTCVSALVRITSSADAVSKFLRRSGEGSVFSRTLIVNGVADPWKIVWLKREGLSLESAMRQAGRTDSSSGVVANAQGLGVRVPAEAFDTCAEFLVGHAEVGLMSGDVYELSGCPVQWGSAAVQEVIEQRGWQATPLKRVQKGRCCNWLVRFATGHVPNVTCLQNEEDAKLIEVRRAKPVVRKPLKELRWRRGAGAGSWSAHSNSSGGPGQTGMEVDAAAADAARTVLAEVAVPNGGTSQRQQPVTQQQQQPQTDIAGMIERGIANAMAKIMREQADHQRKMQEWVQDKCDSMQAEVTDVKDMFAPGEEDYVDPSQAKAAAAATAEAAADTAPLLGKTGPSRQHRAEPYTNAKGRGM